MRNSESGPANPTYKLKIAAGQTLNASGGSYGSLTPLFGKPDDNVVVNWDSASFGPRGPLLVDAAVESTGQVLVTIWNFSGSNITTGTDLFVNVQLIPR